MTVAGVVVVVLGFAAGTVDNFVVVVVAGIAAHRIHNLIHRRKLHRR